MDKKVIMLHVRGYTVDPEIEKEKTKVRMPAVREIYAYFGIDFREIDAWNNGLTTISVFDAVNKARIAVEKAKIENPDAVIVLSGHSLGEVALIVASLVVIDYLIIEDAALGGVYDFVLRFKKFDLKNEAVITGLRKNSPGVKLVKKILSGDYTWPITLEVRSGFAILGQLLFGSFPCTGFGEVLELSNANHSQVWEHPNVIGLIAKFVLDRN